jgi:hypothetical protein
MQARRYRKHLQLHLDRNDLAVYIAKQTVYCSPYILLDLYLLVLDCPYDCNPPTATRGSTVASVSIINRV